MTSIDLSGTEDPNAVSARIDTAVRSLRDIHHAATDRDRRDATHGLAETMLWLRKHCPRGGDPPPDLRGRFHPYRLIIKKIKEDAAGSGRAPLSIPKQVGHQINELIFDDPEISDDTRRAFGFGSVSPHRGAQRRYARERRRNRVYQDVAPRFDLLDEIREIISKVEQLKLSVLDDADDETRTQVRDLLDRVALITGERREEVHDIIHHGR